MLIRPATGDDIPAIRTLEQRTPEAAHWSESSYAALFAPGAPSRTALVAVDEQAALQGFVVALCASEEWEIENIAVAENQRRKGVATALLRSLLQRAQAAGAASLLLEVRESNTAALRSYEKVGFRAAGRRSRYYHVPDEDALLLRLCFGSLTKSLEGE